MTTSFNCVGGVYNTSRTGGSPNNAINVVDTSTGANTLINNYGSSNANALGITKGGTAAYSVFQNPPASSTTVYRYDAVSQAVTTYTGSATAGDNFVAGAIDPATGVYYYANYGGTGAVTIYGFNTNTNTAISGAVATTTLPISTTGGSNGDFAFDSQGNLYLVASIGTTAGIGVVRGPLPTTGGSGALTDTVISTFPVTNNHQINGIAFNNTGLLFVQSYDGTNSYLQKLDPNLGTPIGPELAQGTRAAVDLGVCSSNPSLELHKVVNSRVSGTDQFNLAITGGSLGGGNTATTSGTATGLQTAFAGPVIGVSGTSYTFTETAAGTTNLANYTSTYQCIDTAFNDEVVASGTGTSVTYPLKDPSAGEQGPQISCSFTNTALVPQLVVSKSVNPTSGTVTGPGQSLTYTLTFDNSAGSGAAAVDHTDSLADVTDDATITTAPALATGSGLTVSPVSGGAFTVSGSLAAGATATVTYAVTVNSPDIGDHVLNNYVTPTGTPPPTSCTVGSSTCTTNPVQTPALTITKAAEPATVTQPGDVITDTFVVTNTGSVPLTGVTVTDTQTAPAGALTSGPTCVSLSSPAGSCSGSSTNLAVGQASTFTATYTVTAADIAARGVADSATASGTPPFGPAVTSPPAAALVSVASISIVKTADRQSFAAAGDVVTYTFTVANTGGAPLTGVSVNDAQTAPERSPRARAVCR